MTRGRMGLLVALLATIAVGACRDNRVTLATGRDGGAGNGGAATGGAGTGGGEGDTPDGSVGDGPEHNDAPPGVWVARTPCVVPSEVPASRELEMVAYDADQRKLFVYGGRSSYGGQDTDLWELDVATATWTSHNPCGAMTPPPVETGQLVYDRARRRLLLFSGTEGVVWEWDSDTSAWTMRAPATGGVLPLGDIALAVYDDTRGKVLVFTQRLLPDSPSGAISLWEWDGATAAWVLRAGDGFPWTFISELPAVAFDAGRGALWMFGGYPIDDHLWRLDTASGKLTDLTPAVRPTEWPATRVSAQMTYDPVRGRVVLLGGLHTKYQRDLWELDPATITWRNRTPAGVPIVGTATPTGVAWPAGAPGSGIFADAAGRIVHLGSLFYYYPPNQPPDLWSWDGVSGAWSVRAPAGTLPWPRPAVTRLLAWDGNRGKLLAYDSGLRELWQWGTGVGRWDRLTPAGIVGFGEGPHPVPWPDELSGTAVAWDASARRLVIFGGTKDLLGELSGELWIWDPATNRMTSPPRPSTGWPLPRVNHAMAYDPVRRRVLMFGGSVPEASDELWALDTAQARWERVAPTGDWPSGRTRHALVLDEERGVLVLQGGTGSDASPLSDTWELPAGASAWQQRSPGGTPVSWPSFYTANASFVRGLGVVAMTLVGDLAAPTFALWKWNPTTEAWVAAGVELPLAVPFQSIISEALMGGGADTLFMLLPPSLSRPPHERGFVETWEWRAP